MPVSYSTVKTDLSPAEVLRILTDFGPSRAEGWMGIDEATYKVHDRGESWADVTEGNKFAWERERYEWDSEAGTISAVTTDSNVWGPGSRWDYRITPDNGGSVVKVRLERHGKGIPGNLIGALVPLVGSWAIASSISRALKSK